MSEAGQRAQQGLSDLLAREPLLIGGAGLLIGLAMGCALPATEAENKMIGPVKDDMVEKTKALAADKLEDVGDAASAAYAGAKQSLASGEEDSAKAE